MSRLSQESLLRGLLIITFHIRIAVPYLLQFICGIVMFYILPYTILDTLPSSSTDLSWLPEFLLLHTVGISLADFHLLQMRYVARAIRREHKKAVGMSGWIAGTKISFVLESRLDTNLNCSVGQ